MATPEKCVYVFTSKLGCKKQVSADPVSDESGDGSSMLPCFLEDESSRCTLPSLRLGNASCVKSSEEEAVEELKSSLEARKATIRMAPTAVLQNISRSFGTMIDNRIKQVHLMMLASANDHDKEHDLNLKLASLLCSEKNCPTSFIAAESNFKPLPVSKGHIKQVGRIKAVILPLVFKTTISINILGAKELRVTLTAPGTIVGTFLGSCTRLRTAEINLHTATMYSCMKEQCDHVVTTTFETAAQMLHAEPTTEEHATSKDRMQTPSSSLAICRPQSPTHSHDATRMRHPVSP